MGRYCGDIAIHAALATGAKYLITPETGFDKQHLLDDLKEQNEHGIRYSIVVVTENMMKTHEMAQEIQLVTGIETRATILGHVQRGGSPTAYDRKLGIELGKRAVELIDADQAARCVGIDGVDIIDMDITEALALPAKDKSKLIETFIATK
jgi:6-phosphofructokinase 1